MFEGLSNTDKSLLLKHVESDNMSHAYMFYGAGSNTLDRIAVEFMKMMYCKKSKYYCNECEECRKLNANSNVDVHHIYKDGRSIGIKQIREIRYKASMYSKEYKYNIFVVHEADCMTVEAENAFLKTLEEPYENTIFILLVRSKDVLLDTILSRCLTIRVEETEKEDVIEESEQIYIMETFAELFSGNRLKLVEAAKKLGADRNKAENYMLFMMKFITDVLIYKESNLDITFNEDKGIYRDYIIKINSMASSKALAELMERMIYVNEAIKYNAKASLGFESLFMCIEEDN